MSLPTKPAALLPSLRTRLVRHTLLPLALMWLIATAITASVAYHYAQQAFDRALLDDAYALATNVQAGPQGIQLKLTESELKALLFDQGESVYFALWRKDGSLVSGQAWLSAGPKLTARGFEFSDLNYGGQALRVVTVYRDEGPSGYWVVTAQTTRSRTALLQRVLLFSFGPQGALLLILTWWLRRTIKADLKPLSKLQEALNHRHSNDLTPVAVRASTRDVQQLGTAINSLMTRVGAGVRAQREFSGNVAHELRTPLAGIRALTAYGLAQADPQVWRQQLQAVAASEARASHMVEQLLAMALADETRDSLQLVPVALDTLLRRVVLHVLPRADALGVDLGASGLDEAVRLMSDESLIEGVLNNLLDNALRYGKPAAGITPAITVELRTGDGSVAILIIDNGPGIAADARQDMMQRWQRAGSNAALGINARQGVGLGLPIVTRYAALLGARFELSANESGQGLSAGLYWSV